MNVVVVFYQLWLSCVFLAVGGDNGAVVALPAHKNLLSHPQTLDYLFCRQLTSSPPSQNAHKNRLSLLAD